MAKQTCPVCDWEIEDDGKLVEVDGKTITVCCDDCAGELRANPDKHLKQE